jgi:hypothetical protein
MDYRTGQVLDAIKLVGIEDNTLFIFTISISAVHAITDTASAVPPQHYQIWRNGVAMQTQPYGKGKSSAP